MAFHKFEIDFLGFEYSTEHYKKTLEEKMNHPDFHYFVCVNGDRILGCAGTVRSITDFSDAQTQLVEFGLQPDPTLKKYTQSKILLTLAEAIESKAESLGVDIVAFSLSPKFNIDNAFVKRGYKLTDKIFTKRRGI